jgi:hypothetical protein
MNVGRPFKSRQPSRLGRQYPVCPSAQVGGRERNGILACSALALGSDNRTTVSSSPRKTPSRIFLILSSCLYCTTTFVVAVAVAPLADLAVSV